MLKKIILITFCGLFVFGFNIATRVDAAELKEAPREIMVVRPTILQQDTLQINEVPFTKLKRLAYEVLALKEQIGQKKYQAWVAREARIKALADQISIPKTDTNLLSQNSIRSKVSSSFFGNLFSRFFGKQDDAKTIESKPIKSVLRPELEQKQIRAAAIKPSATPSFGKLAVQERLRNQEIKRLENKIADKVEVISGLIESIFGSVPTDVQIDGSSLKLEAAVATIASLAWADAITRLPLSGVGTRFRLEANANQNVFFGIQQDDASYANSPYLAYFMLLNRISQLRSQSSLDEDALHLAYRQLEYQQALLNNALFNNPTRGVSAIDAALTEAILALHERLVNNGRSILAKDFFNKNLQVSAFFMEALKSVHTSQFVRYLCLPAQIERLDSITWAEQCDKSENSLLYKTIGGANYANSALKLRGGLLIAEPKVRGMPLAMLNLNGGALFGHPAMSLIEFFQNHYLDPVSLGEGCSAHEAVANGGACKSQISCQIQAALASGGSIDPMLPGLTPLTGTLHSEFTVHGVARSELDISFCGAAGSKPGGSFLGRDWSCLLPTRSSPFGPIDPATGNFVSGEIRRIHECVGETALADGLVEVSLSVDGGPSFKQISRDCMGDFASDTRAEQMARSTRGSFEQIFGRTGELFQGDGKSFTNHCRSLAGFLAPGASASVEAFMQAEAETIVSRAIQQAEQDFASAEMRIDFPVEGETDQSRTRLHNFAKRVASIAIGLMKRQMGGGQGLPEADAGEAVARDRIEQASEDYERQTQTADAGTSNQCDPASSARCSSACTPFDQMLADQMECPDGDSTAEGIRAAACLFAVDTCGDIAQEAADMQINSLTACFEAPELRTFASCIASNCPEDNPTCCAEAGGEAPAATAEDLTGVGTPGANPGPEGGFAPSDDSPRIPVVIGGPRGN